MYDRNEAGRQYLTQSFIDGVEDFVSKAYAEEGGLDSRALNAIVQRF